MKAHPCQNLKVFSASLVLWLLALFGARAETIHYTYDSAGRVVLVDYGGGTNVAYSYDANGNLLRKGSATVGDSDNDGMDDAWELLYFGSMLRDGTGDFDGDNASDLAEFLAGNSPVDVASVLKVTRITTQGGANTTIEWSAVPGKMYRVQYKDALDLTTWKDLSGDVPAGGPTASKTDLSPNQIQRYYRVIIPSSP